MALIFDCVPTIKAYKAFEVRSTLSKMHISRWNNPLNILRERNVESELFEAMIKCPNSDNECFYQIIGAYLT